MAKQDQDIDQFLPTEATIEKFYDNPQFDKEWDSVKDQLNKTLVIAFLGTCSSGKTSGVKTLFDIDFGNIHPIPGATTTVKIEKIFDSVFLIDAPGFGDVRTDVSEKAKEICESVDLFVYVLNAEGGYKIQEKEDYQDIIRYGGEILVVLNKIDLLRDHQRDEFIEDQRAKMGVESKNFIPVAFDPHPAISSEPMNIDRVRNWIQDTLDRKGKDLLFAKVSRHKDKICEWWIRNFSVTAAGIGALPIPGSDYVPLTALQVTMARKIAYVYGHSPTKKDIVKLIVQAFTGQIGKQVFKVALTALKALGWIPGAGWASLAATAALAAAIAAATTYGLGKAAQAYYKSGMDIPSVEMQEIFKNAYDQYRSSREKK